MNVYGLELENSAMKLPPRTVKLPARNWGLRTHPIVAIVAHATVGVDSRNTLVTGDGRSVSVHRLIQKFPRLNGSIDVGVGEVPQLEGAIVYEMVPAERVAYQAGFSTLTVRGTTYRPRGINVNEVTLGFEIENKQDGKDTYTEDQLLCAGWCIWDWRQKFGPLPVVRHADIDPTRRSDPQGLSVEALEYWYDRVATEMTVDNWSLWGNRFPLRKDWAIPKAWYVRARLLGMPISEETYISNGVDTSVQLFERGICIYSGKVMRARALLYTEL